MISEVSRIQSSLSLYAAGSKKRVTASSTLEHHTEDPAAKKQRRNHKYDIVIKPSDYVLAAFRANGVVIEESRSKTEQNFVVPTQEMIETYTPEILNAIRSNDLETLKKLHSESKLNVNGCNKFGDSLLHLACRRSHTAIVEFLLKEVKVDIRIRDDFHRTPLHDAAWTPTPNFDLVNFLIKECPEHLYMADVRGFTPLDYVRKDDWGKWLRFLWERKAMFRPKHSPSE